MTQQVLIILGSTGSIDVNTPDATSRHPERFRVFVLVRYRQVEKLVAQCIQLTPEYAMIADTEHAVRPKALLKARDNGTRILHRAQALIDVVSANGVDGVMHTIAGATGLPSALVTAQKGKTIYLIDKETLAVSGALFMETARTNSARALPVSSEHNVIFQVLPRNYTGHLNGHGIRSIILTASDGPFLDTDLAGFEYITPAQAIKHPNWGMGRKISIDPATMMDKGLELIETHWLLNCPPDNLKAVIHPQSVVHSMMHYLDGSVLAQLGNPDMRTPIAYCLRLSERIKPGVGALDFDTLPALTSRRLDLGRFPCLKSAYDVMYASGSVPCVLNTTSEMTVAAFLDGKIRFTDIARVVAHCLDADFPDGLSDIESLLILDT